MKKIDILFAIHTNIKTGSGSEKALYYYLKYADTSRFNITVLETNSIPGGQRLNDTDLEVIRDKTRFIEINDYESLLDSIRIKFLSEPLYVILLPLLFKMLRHTKTLKSLGKLDIVYLFHNNYSYLFTRSEIVVASNHSDFFTNSLMYEIKAKLISLHLLFPSVKAVHLFPHNMKMEKYFYNLPLYSFNNGVDTELYFPKENSNEKLRMLFVGRLEPIKGISMVLDVYRVLKTKIPVELIIVGSGSLEGEVENFSKSDGNVHYLKYVGEKDLAEIYRSCDIFLAPTQSDNYPLVVLEALSSGLKVVTTKVLYEAYKEFIAFDVIRFTDFDATLLSQAVLELAKIEIDKNVIHDYIAREYSWKMISERLFNSLSDLMGAEK